MLCTRPFVKGLAAYGCGQCMCCRINRRRLWTHRMMLEQRCHASSSFVTLTYDKEHHPADGNLVPKDLTDFLKRLRWHLRPVPLRYFGVGEYGSSTWRPHYHLAIFGPVDPHVISLAWPKGFTMAGPLSPQSMAYVSGYVTKKLTRLGDSRLSGRVPEFARMSLRPGIGAPALDSVQAALTTPHGARLVSRLGDVPTTLQHGARSMPLGRYLRTRLREDLGIEDTSNSAYVAARAIEMHQLREKVGRTVYQLGSAQVDWQKVAQVEARARIWRKHETL